MGVEVRKLSETSRYARYSCRLESVMLLLGSGGIIGSLDVDTNNRVSQRPCRAYRDSGSKRGDGREEQEGRDECTQRQAEAECSRSLGSMWERMTYRREDRYYG